MIAGPGAAALVALSALAADPWGRPRHLRAVEARPEAFADRDRAELPLRLWWDGGPATLQVWTPRGWATLAEGASPGWTAPPLPVGARVRARLDGAARWSEPVSAGPWQTPDGLAALLGVGGGDVIGEIAVDGGQVWASTVGGGVWTRPAPGAPWARLGAWEGLPDARALAVSAAAGQVAVGSASGVALFEGGRMVRVLGPEDGLPDPWAQAVRHAGGALWIGTYRGLVRWGPDGMSAGILSPWSVFSLAPDEGGGVWAGYEGVVRVRADGGVERWREGGAAFALRPEGDGVWAALPEGGAVFLEAPGVERPVAGPRGAWGLAPGPGGGWVAAGPEGLWGPDGRRLGRAEGLPADGVRSVSVDPAGGVWVGTDAGLGWVPEAGGHAARVELSGAPVALDVRGLLAAPGGLWVAAGPRGLHIAGRPHPAAGDLAAAVAGQVHELGLGGDGAVWALSDRLLRLGPRRGLQAWSLPADADQLAVFGDDAWVGGDAGLWRAGPRGFTPVPGLRGVRDLHADARGLWVAAPHAVFRVVGGGSMAYVRSHPPLSLAGAEGGLWLGTEDGLERLWVGGDDPGRVDDVLGDLDAGVAVPAVAADGAGGCWFAAADGTVGHVDARGAAWTARLPGADPPAVRALAPDGPDRLWVGTDAGVYRLRRPRP